MPTLLKDADKVIIGDGKFVERASVRFEGKSITAVGRDLSSEGAEVIDCRGKIIIPGLIDVHVHIAMWAGEVDWGNILDIPDEYLALRASTYLAWWIQNGFTTIFEPLARRDLPFEMRRATRDRCAGNVFWPQGSHRWGRSASRGARANQHLSQCRRR